MVHPRVVADKKEFKEKVLKWLATENIFPKKVRVYDSRYGLEVRIYHGHFEYISERVSFREESRDEFQRHGTRGHHMIRVPQYTHITQKDFENPEELEFCLQVIKDYI